MDELERPDPWCCAQGKQSINEWSQFDQTEFTNNFAEIKLKVPLWANKNKSPTNLEFHTSTKFGREREQAVRQCGQDQYRRSVLAGVHQNRQVESSQQTLVGVGGAHWMSPRSEFSHTAALLTLTAASVCTCTKDGRRHHTSPGSHACISTVLACSRPSDWWCTSHYVLYELTSNWTCIDLSKSIHFAAIQTKVNTKPNLLCLLSIVFVWSWSNFLFI